MESVDGSWLLVFFLVCVGFSAFFSSAETAFISLPKLRIRHLVDSGMRGAERVARIMEQPSKFLATILLGNNFVNVAAAALGTVMAVEVFGPALGALVATVGVTVIILVFSEVIPKTFAAHHAERLALLYITPVRGVTWLLFPFAAVLSHIGLGFTRVLSGPEEAKGLVSEEEIRTAITVGEAEGVVEEAEAEMLHKVFEFGDRPVREMMTPRTEITWVEEGSKLGDFLQIYSQAPHSRFPVYKETTDNVVGILSIKDVLKAQADGFITKASPINDLVRPAYFVPETKLLDELLTEMRDGNYNIAMVVDEFGGIAGVVTIEQLVEEIVGGIGDELGEAEKEFVVIGENAFQVDGGLRIDEANEELNLGLPSGDYETIAGFILSHLGRIPKQGEQLKYKDLKLVITEMRRMKIEWVLVTKEEDAAPAG